MHFSLKQHEVEKVGIAGKVDISKRRESQVERNGQTEKTSPEDEACQQYSEVGKTEML